MAEHSRSPLRISSSLRELLSSAGCDNEETQTVLKEDDACNLCDFGDGYDSHEVLLWKGSAPWLELHKKANVILEQRSAANARSALWHKSLQPKAIETSASSTVVSAGPEVRAHTSLGRSACKLRDASARFVGPSSSAAPASTTKTSTVLEKVSLARALLSLLKSHVAYSSKRQQFSSCPPDLESQLDELYVDKFASYSAETQRNALNAWRRWESWASKQSLEPMPAQAVQLALFLKDVFNGIGIRRKNAGGPGAVQSVLAGLRFLTDHLGFQIETRDDLVSLLERLNCTWNFEFTLHTKLPR